MANWANPFYIVGLGLQLILVFYLLYLAVKLHRYFKTARKFAAEPETEAWAKVVMDPEAPRRPTAELVMKVRAGISDTQGEKKMSPWIRRGVMTGIIILIGVLLFNMGVFAPLYTETRRIDVLLVVPISSSYFTNLTGCEGTTVTRMFVIYEGASFIFWFDDRVELTSNEWYEITISPSTKCTGGSAPFWSLLDWREVSGS